MPVLGMGGLFFRAKDPASLKTWYREHLGVGGGMGTDENGQSDEWVWFTKGGPMVFAPFSADTDYFPAEKQVMVNFRVADLDAMLAHFADAQIPVVSKPEWNSPELGRFVRVYDPEGNAIELWEPAAAQG